MNNEEIGFITHYGLNNRPIFFEYVCFHLASHRRLYLSVHKWLRIYVLEWVLKSRDIYFGNKGPLQLTNFSLVEFLLRPFHTKHLHFSIIVRSKRNFGNDLSLDEAYFPFHCFFGGWTSKSYEFGE